MAEDEHIVTYERKRQAQTALGRAQLALRSAKRTVVKKTMRHREHAKTVVRRTIKKRVSKR